MSNSKSGMNTGAKTGIFRKSLIAIILVSSMVAFTATGCKSMNKSQKGAVIGGAGGGVVGAVVGRSMGNTALGAIIGAAVGGVAGCVYEGDSRPILWLWSLLHALGRPERQIRCHDWVRGCRR